MIFLLAPDKFKGSLTAPEVCKAMEEGLHSIDSSLQIISMPLADGGEGTSDVLTGYSQGQTITVKVLDPLFRSITADYGISKDGKTAFIEMAKASGLQLLKNDERNPLHTTSFGTGQLIRDAIDRGAGHIILGIGGSATNDAGCGMAEALGFTFIYRSGNYHHITGEYLRDVASIMTNQVHPRLSKIKFTVLCDVKNPLHGPNGAAHIFGPQKGATETIALTLDAGLIEFQSIAEATFPVDLNFPGAGAAGGLGAGAKAFLRAEIVPGFDFISRFTGLEGLIEKADIILTGEGKIDHQTLSGKVVSGVAKLAVHHRKTCVALTGVCELSPAEQRELHLAEVISLSEGAQSSEDSIDRAAIHIKTAVAAHLKQWISST